MTPAELEAGARALFDRGRLGNWDDPQDCTPATRADLEGDVRVVIAAVSRAHGAGELSS
jgi:hypothetical protein